ncbi:hypothetical protein DL96DRAFT_1585968 [Flagelloscypha sp. PMI_526]|nr:hypothetical protein DL96DRAFT_1585968 [Flagelloscypha sp. PMI_526]
MSSEPPIPKLPPELELRIFEICFFEDRQCLPPLLLICQRVFYCLNAIRYYSMQLNEKAEIKRVQTWIKSQTPQSLNQNVKSILVHLPRVSLYPIIEQIVSLCTGVQHLGLWLYPKSEEHNSPDPLILTALTRLSQVRHLSLNIETEKHLFRLLGYPKKEEEADIIAFRDTLISVDWGGPETPRLPLATFPNSSYIMIEQIWPLKLGDMRTMKDWLSRPRSMGLILLMDESFHLDSSKFDLEDDHILNDKRVVLLQSPRDWAKDWDEHAFGDGQDVFSIGKQRVGLLKLKDRIDFG